MKTTVGKMQKMISGDETDLRFMAMDDWVSVDTPNRTYTVYFRSHEVDPR